MNVLVLAAGGGTRFGGPKALATFDRSRLVPGEQESERTFLEIIVGGLPLAKVTVVIGASADEAQEHHRALDVRWVRNVVWDSTDMMASLRLGLAACGASEPALVWPVDCPHADHDLVLALERAVADAPCPWAAVPHHAGLPGHPIALSPRACAELVASDLGTLREWLEGHRDEVARLDWPNPCVLLNVNTPEDGSR